MDTRSDFVNGICGVIVEKYGNVVKAVKSKEFSELYDGCQEHIMDVYELCCHIDPDIPMFALYEMYNGDKDEDDDFEGITNLCIDMFDDLSSC